MKLNKKTIFWGLLSLGVSLVGMYVSGKQDDAEFEERFNEMYEERKALEAKEDK